MTQRRKRNVHQHGVALAETVLVLPLLLLVTMGALQYGWAFFNLQRITNAARQGARIASALNATDAEGEAAIAALVSDMAGTTYGVATSGSLVTATVTMPKASVQLIEWNLLPLPDNLRAVVTMAKETDES